MPCSAARSPPKAASGPPGASRWSWRTRCSSASCIMNTALGCYPWKADLVAHQHAVAQRGAAFGRHVDAPFCGARGHFRVALRFLQHGPVSRHRLAHHHRGRFLLRIAQHDLVRALEYVARTVKRLAALEIGLLLVRGHVER